MLLRDFYMKVVLNEETALAFLRDYDLLDDDDDVARCSKCGGDMVTAWERDRAGAEFYPVLRYRKKGCQAMHSVQTNNTFFHYTDLNNRANSKLTLCKILEIDFFLVLEISMDDAMTLSGRCKQTITDWCNMRREICSSVMRARPQLMGTHLNPIQIDESYFAGKRKYGRILHGNKPSSSKDDDANATNQQNHGRRIDGP